jgi:hypothetical protein
LAAMNVSLHVLIKKTHQYAKTNSSNYITTGPN